MTTYAPRILITGKPNVGKTTIIQKVLKELPVTYGGFYTEEIREFGVRVGFRLRTTDGAEGVLAHVDSQSPHRVGKYGVEVGAFEDIAIPALDRILRQFTSGETGSSQRTCPYASRGEEEGGRFGEARIPQSIPPYDSGGNLSAYGGQKGGPSGVARLPHSAMLVVIDELGRMELFSQKFQDKVLEIFDHPLPILAVLQDSHNPFLDAIRERDGVRIIRITRKNRDEVVGEIVGRLNAHFRKQQTRA